MRLPDLENLSCFVAAAEHLNFRRAAASVALTPAAFGQRIKQLEDEVGEPLFERTTRAVSLTPAALRLLPKARAVLTAAEAFAQKPVGDQPMNLTLGTRFELGISWLSPAVLHLRTIRPLWRLDLRFGSGPEILELLRTGDVDAVITSAPVARPEWTAEPLQLEDYALVATPSYLANLPFNDASESPNHLLLDLDPTLPLARYFLSAAPAMQFRDVHYCGTGAVVRHFVLADVGVAVLPKYMIATDLESGRLVPLFPHVPLLTDTFRLLFRKTSSRAPALRDLAEFLRSRPLT